MAEALRGRDGEQLTAGLRPESWRVAPATNRNLAATLSHSEVLGNEQVLTCQLQEGSHLVQVRTSPEHDWRPGQTLHLEPDPSGWKLFNSAGEAISPGQQEDAGPSLPDLN